MPDTQLLWQPSPHHASVVGHSASGCVMNDFALLGTLAELIEHPQRPGSHRQVAICRHCGPAPIAWFIDITALPARADAVSDIVTSRTTPEAQRWHMLPHLVSAVGVRSRPAPLTRASMTAALSPPEGAHTRFAALTHRWVQQRIGAIFEAIERARAELYADRWLARAAKMDKLTANDAGPRRWVFLDATAILSDPDHPEHRLLCAALLHPTRFAAPVDSPDGRWTALPLPASWMAGRSATDLCVPTDLAVTANEPPLVIAVTLRLWRDAQLGLLEALLTDPRAAFLAARHLMALPPAP